MGLELGVCYHTFVAGEDLTDAQYHVVKISGFDSAANAPKVALCGDGEKMCGILQNDPDDGEAALVMRVGKSPAVIAAAIDAGTSWASDSNGHIKAVDELEWVGGMVHEAGVTSPTTTGSELTTVDVEALNPWKTPSGFTDE